MSSTPRVPPILWLCLLFIALTSLVRAQDVWTSAATGTTQDLWGAVWSGSQFVVVGNGGTILTSPDGAAWTSRSGGTSAWLVAVGYSAALQRFVAVGDGGTVLTSSDGVAWTPRLSGTSERLNGVTYGGGRFIAVGEHLTVLSSSDGINWSSAKAPSAKDAWLRGITHVGGKFVISGANYEYQDAPFRFQAVATVDGSSFAPAELTPAHAGAFALHTDGEWLIAAYGEVQVGRAVQPLSLGAVHFYFTGIFIDPMEGVTLFNNQWVAAGDNGKIVHGFLTARGTTTFDGPAGIRFRTMASSNDVAIAAGDRGTILRSRAEPLPPALAWPNDVPTRFSIPEGTDVTLEPAVTGGGPLSYQWHLNGHPLPGATARILELSRVRANQSGEYTLTATNPHGTGISPGRHLVVVSPGASYPIDPSFRVATTNSVLAAQEQPDGKVVVLMSLGSGPSSATHAVERLHRDGSRDESFARFVVGGATWIEVKPDGSVIVRGNLILSDSSGIVSVVRLNPDGSRDANFSSGANGQIQLADGRSIRVALSNNVATFSRYHADGSVDPGYVQPPVVLAPAPANIWAMVYSGLLARRAPDGSHRLAFVDRESAGTGIVGANRTQLLRLEPDGSVDPAFFPPAIDEAMIDLQVTATHLHYIGQSSGRGAVWATWAARLGADGRPDASYPKRQGLYTSGGDNPLLLAPDGSVLTQRFGETTREIIVERYDSDGVLDREFSARFTTTYPYAFPAKWAWSGQPNLAFLFARGDERFSGLDWAPLLKLDFGTASAASTRLINLSVRQSAGTGSALLTLGFVTSGEGEKPLLVRAVGPALRDFGISRVLDDPSLALIHHGEVAAANDNWFNPATAAEVMSQTSRAGAFPLAADSKDAALLTAPRNGSYTVQVFGNAGSGIALAEVYDLAAAPTRLASARIVNFSARALAGTAEETLAAGFTIDGQGSRRLLIRAVGPTLSQFGVNGVLSNPILTIRQQDRIVGWNDNWSYSATDAQAAGAFALPTGSKDAGLIVTLGSGVYTAVVTSADAETGVALVELYELP